MNHNKKTSMSLLAFTAALVLSASTALAQSSGGSSSGGGGASGGSAGGGSSAGSRGGSAGSAATSPGASTPGSTAPSTTGPGTTRSGTTAPIGRVGPGSSGGAADANDPRTLDSGSSGTYAPSRTPTPGGTTTPSGTAYPSGPGLEAARQRALQSPPGAIPPSAAGTGGDRSGTSNVGRDADIQGATPGLPNDADPNRGDPGAADRAAGGATRQGAVGKTMAECEAAWDAETHMSKEKWRDTCRRTLTTPHL